MAAELEKIILQSHNIHRQHLFEDRRQHFFHRAQRPLPFFRDRLSLLARNAILGFVLGVLLLATVVVGVVPALDKPAINDISTDLEDPPAFTAAAELPANRDRDMSYPEGFAKVVERAYPGLRTLEMGGPPEQSYRRGLDAAEELGWEVTFRDPDALVFEATDTSALFRFVDDVRVRVRETGSSGSEVDVRSKSRVGQGDLGANAARIRAFADEMRRSEQRDLIR